MAADACPAAQPLCLCGIRGCTAHGTWVNEDIDWRKPRKKRKRAR